MSKIHAIAGLLIVAMLLSGCGAPAAPVTGAGTGTGAVAPPAPVLTAPAEAAAGAAGVQVPDGWTLYSDPDGRFSLALPPGAEIDAGTDKKGVYNARLQFRIPGVDGYQGMLIRSEMLPESAGAEQVQARVYELCGKETPPEEWAAGASPLTIDGLTAMSELAGEDYSVAVPFGGRLVTFSTNHDMIAAGPDPAAAALFFQVLGTFRVAR